MTRFTTSVSERGDKQRLDGLVQFEGVVGGAGHKTSDDDHVGVAVVDDATEDPMDYGEGREEIQSRVDCVATSSWKKLAGQEGSEDDHQQEREGVEDENDRVEWVDGLVGAV